VTDSHPLTTSGIGALCRPGVLNRIYPDLKGFNHCIALYRIEIALNYCLYCLQTNHQVVYATVYATFVILTESVHSTREKQ